LSVDAGWHERNAVLHGQRNAEQRGYDTIERASGGATRSGKTFSRNLI
jgi:hypothetical protein